MHRKDTVYHSNALDTHHVKNSILMLGIDDRLLQVKAYHRYKRKTGYIDTPVPSIHLSQSDMVSFCDRFSSGVRSASSVNVYFKQHLLLNR
jgi:hypothetical protein